MSGCSLILVCPQTRRGLGVPHLQRYYRVSHLIQLTQIFSLAYRPGWITLEVQAGDPHLINLCLLWLPFKDRRATLSPTLLHFLQLWDTVFKTHPFWSPLIYAAPLLKTPLFPQVGPPQQFCWWNNKGLYRIGHFIGSGGIKSAEYLRQNSDMPNSELFRYRQIVHFINSLKLKTDDI